MAELTVPARYASAFRKGVLSEIRISAIRAAEAETKEGAEDLEADLAFTQSLLPQLNLTKKSTVVAPAFVLAHALQATVGEVLIPRLAEVGLHVGESKECAAEAAIAADSLGWAIDASRRFYKQGIADQSRLPEAA